MKCVALNHMVNMVPFVFQIHVCAAAGSCVSLFRVRFAMDIEEMTGERPGWYWRICWNFVSPAVMFVILMASLVFRFMNRPTYLAWDRHAVRIYVESWNIRPKWRVGWSLTRDDAAVTWSSTWSRDLKFHPWTVK